MHVLLSISLLMLLSGCAKQQIVREAIKVKNPPIPANLLIDCMVPDLPEQMTFGDSVQLNVALLLSIENCNGQLEAIREIESSRQGQIAQPQ
ncbi:Rz1-like lysis system protein LysC [Enterobacter roggenkampii]|uniref:Rz1-like lysis system protein LysC n=2 Tax=Enterobacter roggenkampii TaxID=1812935 RepID=UPI003BE73C7A